MHFMQVVRRCMHEITQQSFSSRWETLSYRKMRALKLESFCRHALKLHFWKQNRRKLPQRKMNWIKHNLAGNHEDKTHGGVSCMYTCMCNIEEDMADEFGEEANSIILRWRSISTMRAFVGLWVPLSVGAPWRTPLETPTSPNVNFNTDQLDQSKHGHKWRFQ